ncbi:hypothetical protein [Geminisphaera colitermitum]|nr:hypothetical protein [Geminisphaera colitermitum]
MKPRLEALAQMARVAISFTDNAPSPPPPPPCTYRNGSCRQRGTRSNRRS